MHKIIIAKVIKFILDDKVNIYKGNNGNSAYYKCMAKK